MSPVSRRGIPRLGVLMAPPIVEGSVVDVARRAEALGFDTFYLPDHFNEVLSPLPAIAAVAAATSMRVGAYMLANDLRHPATVARDFAALDVLSDGRVELGVGAGWWPADYHAVGLDMDRPSRRISRLREAVDLIRACWTDETVDHEGTWYRARFKPMTRPIQDPHPPIIVGGGGPKLLQVAAEVADVVSIGIPLTSGRRADMARTSASATFEEVALKVHTARKESPRDPLVDILLFRVAVADRPQDLIDFVAKASGVTPGQVRESPYLQVGSLSQVVAGFDRLVATGIDSIVVRVADMEAAALVRRALG
ncbi:MAG: TIGR03621 family F420-dependent LLM class oxidoreductase [bacterium]|nr:TIGR03621 family F420-dependent LLM class oxidoreductase [bacterium]